MKLYAPVLITSCRMSRDTLYRLSTASSPSGSQSKCLLTALNATP